MLRWVWVQSRYEPIELEDVEWVKPAAHGVQCDVFVKLKGKDAPDVYTGAQASGFLELVLRNLISSSRGDAVAEEPLKRLTRNPSDAMGRIFQQAEAEKDLAHKNGNGNGTHKTRKPKRFKDRDTSVKIMKLKARGRWAEDRGEIELANQYRMEAEAIKASRQT